MEIISRKEAQTRGMNKYFTGKPCVNGHVTYRYTTSSVCYDCLRKNRGDIKLQIDSGNYRNELNTHESKIMEIQRRYGEASAAINSCIDALRNELIVSNDAMLAELRSERDKRRELESSYSAKVAASSLRKVTADRYKESMTKTKMHCPDRHLDEMGEFVITFAKLIWDGFEIDDVWSPKTRMAYVHPSHNKLAFDHMAKLNKVIL